VVSVEIMSRQITRSWTTPRRIHSFLDHIYSQICVVIAPKRSVNARGPARPR